MSNSPLTPEWRDKIRAAALRIKQQPAQYHGDADIVLALLADLEKAEADARTAWATAEGRLLQVADQRSRAESAERDRRRWESNWGYAADEARHLRLDRDRLRDELSTETQRTAIAHRERDLAQKEVEILKRMIPTPSPDEVDRMLTEARDKSRAEHAANARLEALSRESAAKEKAAADRAAMFSAIRDAVVPRATISKPSASQRVHSHGPDEGPGLSCRETRQANDSLRGACLDICESWNCDGSGMAVLGHSYKDDYDGPGHEQVGPCAKRCLDLVGSPGPMVEPGGFDWTNGDAPTVCVQHGAFIPCRTGGVDSAEHRYSSNPFWVKSVSDYQSTSVDGLGWTAPRDDEGWAL
jgi:hypothetical protein